MSIFLTPASTRFVSTNEIAPKLALIVPTKGKDDVLTRCLQAMMAAVEGCPGTVLVVVDNNGDGGEALREVQGLPEHCCIRSDATTVGGVRNDGTRAAGGCDAYAFVDCDCLVPPDFCENVLRVFEESGAVVVGCKVLSPSDGHWTEVAMDAVHRDAGNGPRSHLNSGCLAIQAEDFHALGGFDETLPSNEDYDLCRRVRDRGGNIWQDERLAVVHLGNPKSVAGYLRRLQWHGRGVVRADGTIEWSAMLMATLANSATALGGVSIGVALACAGQPLLALLFVASGLIAVPAVFLLYRMKQFRRWIPVASGVALMQLTFLARQSGFLTRLLELRRARRQSPDHSFTQL